MINRAVWGILLFGFLCSFLGLGRRRIGTVDELSGREETITTVVTLPLVKKEQAVLGPGPEKGPETKGDEMSARCGAILIEMKENPKVSRPMLMKELNLTEKQVRTAIDHIKVAGKAHYEGTGRGGRWVIDE
ncbi:MAG: hypothetical protein IJW67_08800 [Blautia sp.]|nr:hypothetical protein [Blautia sp.]